MTNPTDINPPSKGNTGLACTAIVSPEAELEVSVTIAHFAVIHKDVIIQADSRIGIGVIIYPGTRIGRGVVIEDYAIVGKAPRSPNASTLGRQAFGQTIIEDGVIVASRSTILAGCQLQSGSFLGDNVFMRENCILGCRSTLGSGVRLEFGVKIGQDSLIFTGTYLSENTVVEDEVFIGACVTTASGKAISYRRQLPTEAKGPIIRRGARVGTGSVLHPGIEIDCEAVVAAGAVVFENVPKATIVLGNPARQVKRVSPDEFLLNSGLRPGM